MQNTSEFIGKEIEVKTVDGDNDTTATLIAIEDLGILLESQEDYEDDDGNEGTETVTWYIPFRNIARIQYSPHRSYNQ